MYIRATANARSIGSSSLVIEMVESMIITKSNVIEERCYKGLYS